MNLLLVVLVFLTACGDSVVQPDVGPEVLELDASRVDDAPIDASACELATCCDAVRAGCELPTSSCSVPDGARCIEFICDGSTYRVCRP